jgi:glycerophosphoryl diester phosphodiesterase
VSASDFEVSAFVYAHRGLWDEDKPENSVAAFEAAARAGLGAELDARVTGDGQIVVFHDPTLERMCGRPERIDAMATEDVRKVHLPDGSHIPTLNEALEAMAGMPVLIEVKIDLTPGSDVYNRRGLPALLRSMQVSDAPAAVMSFDEVTMTMLAPGLAGRPAGQLIERGDPHYPGATLAKARRAIDRGCSYLAPELSELDRVAMAFPGFPLVSWTARSTADLMLCRRFDASPIFEAMQPDVAKGSVKQQ